MNYSFKMKARKIAIALVTGVTAISMSGLTAFAADTTINTTLTAGTLTVTSPGSADLGSVTGGIAFQDVTNGALGLITHTDARNSGEGWGTTVHATNLGYYFDDTAPPANLVSVNGGHTQAITNLNGRFDGKHCRSGHLANGAMSCGEFTLTVNTVDGSNYADSVTIDAPDADQVITNADGAHNITVGGITVTLGTAGAGVNGAVMKLHVDSFSFPQTLYTPSSKVTVSGDPTSVDLGDAGGFATIVSEYADSVSADQTELSAPKYFGMGQYTTNSSLLWRLHGNALAGSYKAVLTYTISGA